MKNTRIALFEAFQIQKSISTDTRTLRSGDIYFALKGDNFNGNLYAQKAIENGASLVVIDEDVSGIDENNFIKVDSTLVALQMLASDYRKSLNATIIGLTGSNGKTTCKELFAQVLAKKYIIHATKGNLNNHIGVPLTILSAPINTEFLIVEMGANHQGEIAELCQIAQPNIGYITHFGRAHLEGFGGVEGIIKGKSELYEYLKLNGGKALINADDPIQVEKTNELQKVSFGEKNKADFKFEKSHTETAGLIFDETKINSNLTGDFHFNNIAAACALGLIFEISKEEIKSAIENYQPKMNRSEWKTTDKNTIFLDAYNANPDSMQAAIETFSKLNKSNKWFVLGDMFELGKYEATEHQNIVDLCEKLQLKNVVFVGEAFFKTLNGDAFEKIKSTDEAVELFKEKQLRDATIMLKGSRGMHLESLLELL